MAKVCRCVYISASTCFWCCVSVKRSFKIFKGEPKQLRLLSLHGHCTPRHTLAACLIVLCGITVLILGQRPVSNNTWITSIWTSVTWPNFDDDLLIVWHKFDILTSRICFARPRRSDWSRCCSGPPPHPRVDLDNTTSRRKTSLRLGREMVLVWCWWNRETVKPWNRETGHKMSQDVTRCHKMSQDVTSFANETLTGNSCSLGSTLHLAAEMKLPHVYEHCKRLVAKCVKTWTTLVQWDLGPWLECSHAYQNVRRLAKDRNSRLKVESWVSMVVMWCRCILVCSVAHSALLDKANGLAKEEWA